MNNFDQGRGLNYVSSSSYAPVAIQPLMRLVYIWMFFGLLTTAAVSFVVSSSEQFIINVANFWWPIIIAEFAVVIGLSWGLRKMSPTLAGFLFFVYSALNGLTFGLIFAVYVSMGEATAIAAAFFTTAGLFGAMTVVGMTTKIDLTQYSSYFGMALLGLFIAMIVNIFVGGSALYFVVSVVGVILFTALTAYDTQRIKKMAASPEFSQYGDATTKLAIFGALQLYLDFINLFLFLLRLFGGSRR